MKEYELILCRYNEDINWLTSFLNLRNYYHVSVYNKSDLPMNINSNNISIIKQNNIGREPYTYLVHIVNNYDNLANKNIFLQANPFDNIDRNSFYHNISHIESENISFYQIFTGNNFMEPIQRVVHPVYNPTYGDVLDLGKWWDYFFDAPFSITNNTYPMHALFALSKETIQIHPIEYYKKLVNLIETQPITQWVFEFFWQYFWNDGIKKKLI